MMKISPYGKCFFLIVAISGATLGLQMDEPSSPFEPQFQVERRSSAYDYYLAKAMMDGLRDDLCSKDSLNELVPKVISMKRMIIKRLANPRVPSQRAIELDPESQELDESGGPVPAWKIQEWTKQVHDIERRLAFCSRRNNVSKIRLL